jgi:hypothetical protein
MTNDDLIYVKCAVACTNSNGEADLYYCKVACTEQQYALGDHYSGAKLSAVREGYEPALVFDEIERPEVMKLFEWSTASYVNIDGDETESRPAGRPEGFDEVEDLIDDLKSKDFWSEHSKWSRSYWRDEIEDRSTQLGYWDWLRHRLEEDRNES